MRFRARVRFPCYIESPEVAQYYTRIELTLDWRHDEMAGRDESNVWLLMV